MKYKMKTDVWIRLLLWAVMLMFIPMFFFVPEDEVYILIITTFVMAIIIIPLFFAYYELDDTELVIHFYVFKFKIKYDNIKSIRLCENWMSSMAMSRKRIEIKEHGKGFVKGTTYISPENREDFYSDLKLRCRNLEHKDSTIFEDMDQHKFDNYK